MYRKGQGAIEYLATYGWALVVVVVVGAAFTSWGLLDTENYRVREVDGLTYFSYVDQKLDVDSYRLQLRNSIEWVTIRGIRLGNEAMNMTPYISRDQPITPGREFMIFTELVPPGLIKGEMYELDFEILYDVQEGISDKTEKGKIRTRVVGPPDTTTTISATTSTTEPSSTTTTSSSTTTTLPDIVWERSFDSGLDDYATAVAVDSNDNVIVTGHSGMGNPDNANYYTIKYDPDGNQLWNRTYDGAIVDHANGVAVDSNNNVIVTGYTNPGNDFNYYTIKYDPDGNQLWNKTWDGGPLDYAHGVAADSQNNVIVTGEFSIGGTLNWYTRKYDQNGNHLWSRMYDSGKNDMAHGVAADSNNNIIVTGQYSAGVPDTNYLTIKYDSNGNQLWNRTYDRGGGENDAAFSVAVDSNNNIIVTGYSTSGFIPHYYTIKYDPNGNQLWNRTYSSGGTDWASGVAIDSQDNVIVTGQSKNNYYTIKYDSNGNQLWDKTYDDGNIDYAHAVAVDSQGKIIVIGNSKIGASYDYFTIKYSG